MSAPVSQEVMYLLSSGEGPASAGSGVVELGNVSLYAANLGGIKQAGPSPRYLELSQKKADGELAPQEEGEMRGLLVYPDDPRAAGLLQKEYLYSQGLGEFGDDEREQLRLIRVEDYARRPREAINTDDQGKAEPRPSEEHQTRARSDELHLLLMQAKIADLQGEWRNRNPKAVIDEMVGAIPDEVTVYTLDNLQLMPKNEPSRLELYFMSRLPGLIGLERDDRPEGGLSVMESVLCLRDQVRTKRFLQGIAEAVGQLETSAEGAIEVCDAGTGALPVLSIYAALCSDRVQCTALELNPNSAAIARQVVGAFGLQDRIAIVEADATKFVPEKPLDLLVSETMHSGLTQEPIVQILSNLQPHVKDGGLTLPSNIKVKAALVGVEDWAKPGKFVKIYGDQHIVFDADWQEVANYNPGDLLEQIEFGISTEGVAHRSHLLFVTTDVEIGSGQLDTYQSLITMPQCARDANGNEEVFTIRPGSQTGIFTSYKPGQKLNGVSKVR